MTQLLSQRAGRRMRSLIISLGILISTMAHAEDASDLACQRISEQAAKTNTKVLIIGYEGLASYDSTSALGLYQYRCAVARAQVAQKPGKMLGGFLVHGLLKPMVEAYGNKIEVLVFPHDETKEVMGSVPQRCAEIWMKADGDPRKLGRKLMITGHSYGGHAATQLAQALNKKEIPVDSVITVDPRTRFGVGNLERTENALHWNNYYQSITPFLNGYQVKGADENHYVSGTIHGSMPYAQDVIEGMNTALGRAVKASGSGPKAQDSGASCSLHNHGQSPYLPWINDPKDAAGDSKKPMAPIQSESEDQEAN